MTKARDMTSGNSFHLLVMFTIPLILGNVFQLTYNMVDSILVGRFAGKEALGAVGTSDPIMTLIILGVSGMCVGASVFMSELFGSGQKDVLKEEMHTLTFMGIGFSMIVLIVGVLFSKSLLILLKCPTSILEKANLYLKIVFLGMPFTVLYNVYAYALRSIGNSMTPLIYLAIASILNMTLDFIFIYFFHLHVIGAALATVISEGVSAILCMMYTEKNIEYLRFDWTCLKIEKELVQKTLSYGLFSALQQSTQPIGKLFIQGTVNSLGVASIAAFNAVGKIEDIGLVPGRSISNALTTFVAQNKGAKQNERIKIGFKQAALMEFIVGLLISFGIYLSRYPLMSLFSSDASIIKEGTAYFSIMFVAYVLSNLSNIHQGYFRGVGYLKTTFYGSITQITVRVFVTMFFVPIFGIQGIGYACMIGWICQLGWQGPYRYIVSKRMEREGI